MKRIASRTGLLLVSVIAVGSACTMVLGDFELGGGGGTGGVGASPTTSSGGGGGGAGGAGGTGGTGGAAPCATQCPLGEADCVDCDGICETIVFSDALNCGGCGITCDAGTTCNSGLCGVVTLATGLTGAFGIAVDDSFLYWVDDAGGTDAGTIAKLDKTIVTIGTPETLIDQEAAPLYITVAGTELFWTNRNNGTVRRMSIEGVNPLSVTGTIGNPRGVVVDSDGMRVVWADGTGFIRGAPLSTLASLQSPLVDAPGAPYGVAIDGAQVYWTDESQNRIMRAPKSGGQATTIASTDPFVPRSIAVRGQFVYWTEAAAGTGHIMRAPIGAENVSGTQIATSTSPYELAVDDVHVYWTDPGVPSIFRAPIDASGPLVSIHTPPDQPRGITLDATHVYWAADSVVQKMRK